MRSLNQLYLVLWEAIKDSEYIAGLCIEILELEFSNIITHKEFRLLYDHFKSQHPCSNLHQEFLLSDTWRGGVFWWSASEDLNPINRKAFIQKMIQITEKQG